VIRSDWLVDSPDRGALRVTGLAELRRNLRKAGDPKIVDGVFRTAGKEIARDVRMRVLVEAALTGRREIRKAAATVTESSTVRGAALRAGGPWQLGALFGAHHNDIRWTPGGRTFLGYNQFTTPQRDGGPIFRAIRHERPSIESRYLTLLADLITKD
jgi:hypothetical protein